MDGDRAIREIGEGCVLRRARMISRVLTGIYDEAYRPYGINSPQLILLTLISQMGPASRAELGRVNQQDRSTMTRNLELMFAEGWIEEVAHDGKGRARPLAITPKGRKLVVDTVPAWRAAQAKAKEILGKAGVDLIVSVGNSLTVD